MTTTETATATAPIPGLISVVMPCFNAEAYVKEAVESALGQSYPHVELIVVDDGSVDRSPQILEGLQAINSSRMRLLHQYRSGPFPARNLALRHARGEFIAFLDADDWWRHDALELLHQALTENGAELAYCGWQNVGPKIEAKPYVPPEYEKLDTADYFLKSCPWPIHGALTRRSTIDAVGAFSERRFSAMDYDLWLRIYGITERFVRVPEVLAFYRWHSPAQISATSWRQVLDARRVRRDFIAHHPARVLHMSQKRLKEVTEDVVLAAAYKAFWKRDLVSAQRLFRHALRHGYWRRSDARHVVTAMLPMPVYQWLVGLADRRAGA